MNEDAVIKQAVEERQAKAELDAKIEKVLDAVEFIRGWRPKAICRDQTGTIKVCWAYKEFPTDFDGYEWDNAGDSVDWCEMSGDLFPNHKDHKTPIFFTDHKDWETPIYMESK